MNNAANWKWYSGSNGGTLVGTGSTLSVSPISQTTYYARGEGVCLSQPGGYDSIIINTALSPSVITPPHDSAICFGGNVSFTVAATGTAIVYQWQESTGGSFINITNGGRYSGANTSTLIITGPSIAMNGYKYRCNITGICAPTMSSNSATMIVNPIPTVNAIADQSICKGSSATAINFSGNVNGAIYNWTNNNTGIGLAASGTGNISSFIAANPGSNSITGTITVMPIASGCTGQSNSFTITVNPTPLVNPVTNQSVCNNASTTAVNFTGTITGATYTWANSNTATGLAANGTGNINAFTATNTGSGPIVSTVTVTPSAGSCAGSPVIFNITVKPTPTVAAASIPNLTICSNNSGGATTFSGPVSGTAFTWVNNNTAIGLTASGTGNISNFLATNSGANAITGTVTVTPSANGCTGPSSGFTITVNALPSITSQPSDKTICVGDNTVYSLTATGTGLSYQWQENNGAGFVNLNNISPYSGVTSNTLTITSTPLSMNNNQYRCIVSGACTPSVTSNAVNLTINTPPVITLQPYGIYDCPGIDTAFSINAVGSSLSYQWQVDTGTGFTNIANTLPYSGVSTSRLGITAPSYTLNNYKYRCVVSGTCTPQAVSNSATLQVRPILILSQTTEDSVCEGEPATMRVNTYGSGLRFQWQVKAQGGVYADIKTSPPYSGVTNDQLNISQVDASMNGNMYRCRVYDDLLCNTSVYSADIPMKINILPLISGDANVYEEGQQAVLTIGNTLGADVTYQWQEDKHNGTGYSNLFDNADHSGANTPTLTFVNVKAMQNNYSYRCVLANYCVNGVVTKPATLKVDASTGIFNSFTDKMNVTIYPNPVGSELFIKTSQQDGRFNIRVMDITGRILIIQDLKMTHGIASVNVANLYEGIYTIQLTDKDSNATMIMSIVKLH